RGGGVAVVVGVPEQAAVVRRPVAPGVVDVNVHDVPGQRVEQIDPARVAGAEVLQNGAVYHVVLVVVMGHHGRRSLVVGCLVVAEALAVVPPAVFVDHLAAGQ